MNKTEKQIKQLCVGLMKADSEAEVISLLQQFGVWEDQNCWRFYSDYENNYNSIGNQQSRPDAALIEKLVNAVDARLMNECLVRGIDPESPQAPQSIREAVARFFDDSTDSTRPTAGLITEWGNQKRNDVARGATLAATGFAPKEGNPCFSIADQGEGQTPEKMPKTFLSLTGSNKLRIPFVQGKFNMGGTGILMFCGRHNFQLILTRRNPTIVNGKLSHPSDSQWGFTIVRREDPDLLDGRKSSRYSYLAPLGADRNPGAGGVLRFSADTMPIFPEGTNAYARQSGWGTLIKLYEYAATGFRSNIIFSGGGLLSRMDLLLPDMALPVRLHECRSSYKGHGGSFETSLIGLGVRLADNKGENLEEGFPSSCPISAAGEQMIATVYAFKKGKAETYRRNEGVIFTQNGQTQGYLTQDFFRRNQVGLSYLMDSILVMVDCTNFSGRAREDLFMNSRDRLRQSGLRAAIETALEDMLKHHDGLRALRERRRREEIDTKLDDSKPLEDVLRTLLKQSPMLSALFLKGSRLANPFKMSKGKGSDEPFRGERYPTFFKFRSKDYGEALMRDCHINTRCRVLFETDANNDYFSRDIDPGSFDLYRETDGKRYPVADYVGPSLQNGAASLSLQLPANCVEDDILSYVGVVSDRTRIEPFENRFTIHVQGVANKNGGGGGSTRPRDKNKNGTGKDEIPPSGIALPNITRVFSGDWDKHNPPFDRFTALRIKHAGKATAEGELSTNGNGNADDRDVYDFFVNMDNVYLGTEMKGTKKDSELIRARFTYGMVLLGLAMLQEERQAKSRHVRTEEEGEDKEQAAGQNVEDKVEQFCKAAAVVLLPLIESLGDLDVEEAVAMSASGEAT